MAELFSLLGVSAPGTCPECGIAHHPHKPHNRDSLKYWYNFYLKHHRWPTWADAMAHCSKTVKRLWIEELKKRGIEVAICRT